MQIIRRTHPLPPTAPNDGLRLGWLGMYFGSVFKLASTSPNRGTVGGVLGLAAAGLPHAARCNENALS